MLPSATGHASTSSRSTRAAIVSHAANNYISHGTGGAIPPVTRTVINAGGYRAKYARTTEGTTEVNPGVGAVSSVTSSGTCTIFDGRPLPMQSDACIRQMHADTPGRGYIDPVAATGTGDDKVNAHAGTTGTGPDVTVVYAADAASPALH